MYEREVRKQKSASFAKAPEAKEVSLSQSVVPESAQTPVVEPVVPMDRQDVQDRVPVSDPTSELPQPVIPEPEPTSSTLVPEPVAAATPEPEDSCSPGAQSPGEKTRRQSGVATEESAEAPCSPGAQSPGSAEQAPSLRNDGVPVATEVAPAPAPQPLEPAPVREPEPAAQVVEPVPEPVAAATLEPEDSCSPGALPPGGAYGVATKSLSPSEPTVANQ